MDHFRELSSPKRVLACEVVAEASLVAISEADAGDLFGLFQLDPLTVDVSLCGLHVESGENWMKG